jgi:hypothetical protein
MTIHAIVVKKRNRVGSSIFIVVLGLSNDNRTCQEEPPK